MPSPPNRAFFYRRHPRHHRAAQFCVFLRCASQERAGLQDLVRGGQRHVLGASIAAILSHPRRRLFLQLATGRPSGTCNLKWALSSVYLLSCIVPHMGSAILGAHRLVLLPRPVEDMYAAIPRTLVVAKTRQTFSVSSESSDSFQCTLASVHACASSSSFGCVV